MTANEILSKIDAAIAPEKMGADTAIELLEEVQEGVEVRIEGLRNDMENPC